MAEPWAAKLAHALPEVRRRALRSVQFKLQNGLLAPAALAQDADLLGGLLGWFERDADEPSCAVALEVLSALAQHPGVAAQLLALGADQAMLRLQPGLPPHLGALADQLLADLCISRRAAGSDGAAGGDQLPASYSVPQLEGCLQPAAVVQLQSATGWSPLGLASPGQELSAAPSPPAQAAPDTPGSAFVYSTSRRAVQQGAGRDGQAAAITQQHMEALARYGRSVTAVRLSPEDQQQLSDLMVQLQLERPEDEAAAQQALLQLHAGALADIPVAGILAGPGVIAALGGLVNGGAPAAVRLAALGCVHRVVSSMAAAVSAAEAAAGATEAAEDMPIGPVAHQLLQACARALGDARLHHVAVALLADLLPLTATAGPLPTEEVAAFCYSWRSALAAIADALHLAMVAACTDADIVPPQDWQHGCLSIVVDVRVKFLAELAAQCLALIPEEHLAEAVPAPLVPLLSGLYSSPLAAALLPSAAALAPRMGALAPATQQLLEEAAHLSNRKAQLLGAMQQLAVLSRPGQVPGAAVVMAACRQGLDCLPALSLLGRQEAENAARSVVLSIIAWCEASEAPPAPMANLAAALLAHPVPAVRGAAASTLAEGAAGSRGALELALQELVVGALATVGLADELLQPHALRILQCAAAADGGRASAALLAWQPWLASYRACPAPVGPAVCGLLQLLQEVPGSTIWSRLLPDILDLFSADAARSSQAASHLFGVVVGRPQGPALQFSLEPFAGMLEPAQAAAPAAWQSPSCIAAQLFSLEDVQGLVHAACSSSVPPEVTAQALAQLAQVVCDARFHDVLGTEGVLARLVERLAAPAPGACDLLPAALDCLVQVLTHVPAAADWFLAGADRNALPLLSLAFHPAPMVRCMAAQALHHLVLARSSVQWHQLRGQLPSIQKGAAGAGGPLWSAIPAPLACQRLFAVSPVFATPVALGGSGSTAGGEDTCMSEKALRLWRAQQLVQATACSGSALAPLLSEEGEEVQALPWRRGFVRASLATLERLNVGAELGEALRRLRESRNHAECHAVLARLHLVSGLQEGIEALARLGWHGSMHFLLSKPPLSTDDAQLWLALLPLVERITTSGRASSEDLQQLAAEFVGGAGLQWLQSAAAPGQGGGEDGAVTCQLTQGVMQLCSAVLGECMTAAPCHLLLEAVQLEAWTRLLLGYICDETALYSSRLAAAGLLARLTELAQHAVTRPPGVREAEAWLLHGPARGALLGTITPLLRHVLMAKQWWHPQHYHGKAIVQCTLRQLLCVTRLLPAEEWAAAWAALGGTHWLSWLCKDQDASVRERAFSLLGALACPPATRAMLAAGWPECGGVACKVAADAAECGGARAAALRVVAAAMAGNPQEAGTAEVAGGGEVACFTPGATGGVLGGHGCTLCPAFMIQQASMWAAACEAAQDASTSPALRSAAAHALLQHALIDAVSAWDLLATAQPACLANLLSAPLRLAERWDSTAGAPSQPLPGSPAEWQELEHALAAAGAAAGLVAVLVQLVQPSRPLVCREEVLGPLLSSCTLSARLDSAVSPAARTPPAAFRAQAAARRALAALADAAALLLASGHAWRAALVRNSTLVGPLPLAAALAAALQHAECVQVVQGTCNRLLQVVLHRQDWADAFLQGPTGQEHMLGGDQVGASLCLLLVEQLVAQQQQQQQQGPLGPSSQALVAALRGLLAHSAPAKAAAIQLGLHSLLLETCRTLASALAGSAGTGSKPAAADRASKLQALKNQRAAAATGVAQQTRGRGLTASRGRCARPSMPQGTLEDGEAATGLQDGQQQQRQQKQAADAVAVAEEQPAQDEASAGRPGCAAVEVPGGSGAQQEEPKLQRLLLCLDLLKHLAFNSQAASDALAASGLAATAAGPLWSLGSGPSVAFHSLLELLLNSASSSKAMRASWAAPGGKEGGGLMARLLAAVLHPSLPLPLHRQAATTLCCFLAAADGCAAALRAELPRQALRSLQDFMAARDWARLEGLLQVLASVAAQPDGQRALLRTTAPSGSLFELLLGLLHHHSPAVAAGAAAVLRNAALLPENKAHFLARGGALQLLVDVLGQAAEQPARAVYAAGALWALVHDGEKVKASLRRVNSLRDALTAAAHSCGNALEDDAAEGAVAMHEQLLASCEALALLMR